MTNEERWNFYFEELVRYKKKYGNVDVPVDYEIKFIKLGCWLKKQISDFYRDKLDMWKIEKLESLGIKWIITSKWDERYNYLLDYKEQYGTTAVPRSYIVNDFRLGLWVTTQRILYNNNKLSKERIQKLDNIGFEWNLKDNIMWDEYYNLLMKYKEQYGNIDIPIKYEMDNIKLGDWLARQRVSYRAHKLTEEQIEKLNNLGIKWDLKNKISWDEYYNLLMEYKEQYGNVNVPNQYEINGVKLGHWINNQRRAYRGDKNRIITQEQIEKLESLGIYWGKSYNEIWKKGVNLLVKYKLEHKNLDVPDDYVVDGFELGKWLNNKRLLYKNGKLDKKQVKLLNYIGVDWNLNRKSRKNYNLWNEYYNLLIKYKEQYENVNVAQSFEMDGKKLGLWIRNQKVFYKNNKLPQDLIKKLEDLGVTLSFKKQISWGEYYNLLVKYKEQYGNVDIPSMYEVDGIHLGTWIGQQRMLYRNNKLSKEKIEALEKMGVVLNINLKEKYSWEEYYNLLVKYKEQYGNIDVPIKYEINGIKLGVWLANHRSGYYGTGHYLISDERIVKLNALGIDWSPKDTGRLNKEVNDKNKENYQLTLYKRLQKVLRDLQLEDINEINNIEDQKEAEKIIIKRLFR